MEEITQNMPPSSQHRPYSHKVLTLLFFKTVHQTNCFSNTTLTIGHKMGCDMPWLFISKYNVYIIPTSNRLHNIRQSQPIKIKISIFPISIGPLFTSFTSNCPLERSMASFTPVPNPQNVFSWLRTCTFTANQRYMAVFGCITFHIKLPENLSLQIIRLYNKRFCIFCNFKTLSPSRKTVRSFLSQSCRINQFTIGIQPPPYHHKESIWMSRLWGLQ